MKLAPQTTIRPRGRRAVVAVALAAAAGSVGVASHASAITEPALDCVEEIHPAAAPMLDEAQLSTFGPLAAEPSLDISFAGGQIFSADRAPGGVLVDRYLGGEQYALTFVEDSGAVRWTRCLAGGWSMPLVGDAADAPTGVLVFSSYPDRWELSVIDLAMGHDVALPAALASVPDTAQLATWNDRYALFTTGGDPATGDVGRGDLVLVDLATLEPTTITVPEQVASGANEFPGYRLADNGTVGLASATAYSTTESVFVDGAWTDDPAVIDATLPVTVGVDDFDTMEMVGHSASGSALWTLPGVTDPSREGFHDATIDEVTLVAVCTRRDADGMFCLEEALVAVDSQTGEELWRLPGSRGVYASGNGYAIISGEFVPPAAGAEPVNPDVVMIDVATGTPVDGQSWPGGTFLAGCCDDPAFTMSSGGVVLTGDDAGLRVYLPVSVEAGPTVPVTL